MGARVFNTLIPLIIVGVFVYAFRTPLFVVSHQALRSVSPCTVPIPYAIGAIDPRFGLTESEVVSATERAIAVWEDAIGTDLFVRTASGTPVVTVNFQYDLRQETTETLKDIEAEISTGTDRYDALEAEYEEARASFLSRKAAFDAESAAFSRDIRAYEREVAQWNARGGAPQSVVNRLNSEKAQLAERQKELERERDAVNALADSVNALVTNLNAVAREINRDAKTYNTVGAQTGEEFEEGVYESAAGRETITVFEFDSQTRLERLLAHEFGHALGLDHVEGSESIMYRLNQSMNAEPTPEDIAELERVCKA